MSYVSKLLFAWLPRFLACGVMYLLSFIHASLATSISSLVQLTLGIFGRGSSNAGANVQDDLISTSGDGSQLADEESDQEEIFTNKPPIESSAKKTKQQQQKSRPRGHTPASINLEDQPRSTDGGAEFPHENGVMQQKESNMWKPAQNGHHAMLVNGDYKYGNCNGKTAEDLTNNNMNKENNNSPFSVDEYKQLHKEKEMYVLGARFS